MVGLHVAFCHENSLANITSIGFIPGLVISSLEYNTYMCPDMGLQIASLRERFPALIKWAQESGHL